MGCGLFHDAHRAVDDCRALLEILARPLPATGEPALKRLLDTARKATYRIWAANSPYDLKDQLKGRGYRWSDGADGRARSWWVDVTEEQLDQELKYLETDIYGRPVDLPIAKLTAFERFSDRV
jgi:DNA polymerase-3 subunit epsilon